MHGYHVPSASRIRRNSICISSCSNSLLYVFPGLSPIFPMRSSCFLAAWLLQPLVAGCVDTVAASWSAPDLKSKLSQSANVISPSSSNWSTLVARASYPRVDPAYKVIVEVATEADIQATVKYANKYDIPFLAVSGTHGWAKSLNGLKGGIQISLRKLNKSTVDKGGQTATIEGGSLQWEALADLYKEGKQAVTGICECVSVAGPLLGGGHSQLQNQYGFALDNLVSARVVLANGTVAVASASSNADLYWALRGAGHNFGVVSNLQVKIYDVHQWTVFAFIFPQEKLEALYTVVNKIDNPKTRPAKLMTTGVFARVDAIDPVNVSTSPLCHIDQDTDLFHSLPSSTPSRMKAPRPRCKSTPINSSLSGLSRQPSRRTSITSTCTL